MQESGMAYNYYYYYNYIIIIIITALCNMPKANKVEQKEACYEAVKIVNEAKYDSAYGVIYFESEQMKIIGIAKY